MLTFSINPLLTTKYELTRHIDTTLPAYRDENNKRNEAGDKEVALRLLKVELDFTDVTPAEVEYFLSKQTTPLKMLYNNVLKHWSDAKVLEECKKGLYKVKVRELLDNRKSRSLTDGQKMERSMQKELDKGKTVEQLRTEYMAELDRLEALEKK